ncbi:uncharacterized protein LOC114806513 [Ornithorhynchus anatinus]|uniref:uncharacterized protein LOC114806513 n=1 Tax=Ornithorhynchus anatinus TaxID=9258 RepID=UPI0010A85A2B|nr:uncharacterized protein LOC114806513 [Ornithorhynchus anatinus]
MESQESEFEIEYLVGQTAGTTSEEPSGSYAPPEDQAWLVLRIWVEGARDLEGNSKPDEAKGVAIQALAEGLHDLWRKLEGKDFWIETISSYNLAEVDRNWMEKRVGLSRGWGYIVNKRWKVDPNGPIIRDPRVLRSALQTLVESIHDLWYRLGQREDSKDSRPWEFIVETGSFVDEFPDIPMKGEGEMEEESGEEGDEEWWEKGADTNVHDIWGPGVEESDIDTDEESNPEDGAVMHYSHFKALALWESPKYMTGKKGMARGMWDFEPLNGILREIVPPVWEDTSEAWARDSLEADQQQVTPFHFLPKHKWYPLLEESSEEDVQPIHILEDRGDFMPGVSPSDAPLWPAKKSRAPWSSRIDSWALSEATAQLIPMVTTYQGSEDKVPENAPWLPGPSTDNWFLSRPLDPFSQPKITFTWGKQRYCWTRLPWGFLHNIAIFHPAVQGVLAELYPRVAPDEKELLCWGVSEEKTQRVTGIIIKRLTGVGLKLDAHEAQLVQREGSFLGLKVEACKWKLGPISLILINPNLASCNLPAISPTM